MGLVHSIRSATLRRQTTSQGDVGWTGLGVDCGKARKTVQTSVRSIEHEREQDSGFSGGAEMLATTVP